MSCPENTRRTYIKDLVFSDVPIATTHLAQTLQEKFPGSSVILYGSGISLLKNAQQKDVLYDFYVIVPSYKEAYTSHLLRVLNYAIPPNVFYIESKTNDGLRRAKYAVLSIDHFEKLVSKKTFHSYFWARFAQPCRIIQAAPSMKSRLISALETAVDTFVHNSAHLTGQTQEKDPNNFHDIWINGLGRSYRAELRAEQPERVKKLLDSYGEWPNRVSIPQHTSRSRQSADLAWKVRSVQGGILSVLRLLKGILTFEGGVDYIVWKISRHAGFTVPVRDWERKWPLLGAPFLARRYYKLKNKTNPESK